MMKRIFLLAFAALAFAACSDDASGVPDKPEQPAPPVVVTGISLDCKEVETLPGKPLQLIATLTPVDAEGAVTWSSDNKAVATVSESGMVEVLSAGRAVITATCGEFSANCIIRVNELISFEPGEHMTDIDGKAVVLGPISVVSDSNTATYSDIYWAKAYTVANGLIDEYDQLYFAAPFFSTADKSTWFSSYYCDSTIYGTQLDAWGGFILSSNTNKSVSPSQAGQDNQFEAYTDGGADGSKVFAVCYDAKGAGMAMNGTDPSWPQIDFTDGTREPLSIALANSTWTYNYFNGNAGDSYAVKITGLADGAEVGSVTCPLISSADKAASWKTFDLSSLGAVDCLRFAVVSSEKIAPYYFCVDNIILK